MTDQAPTPSTEGPDQLSFDEDPIPDESSVRRRPWRKYLFVGAAILICFGVFLFRGRLIPRVRGSAAAEEMLPQAGTLVVSQTGGGQYSSIKAAVANASPGTTIIVRTGTYREAIAIDKDITLVGDPGATIECAQDGCLRITAAKATIRNLFINAKVGVLSRLLNYRKRTAAVMILNGRSVIENCEVTSNNGTGILVSGSGSAPEIRDVRVHDCYLNGILFTNQSTGLVEKSAAYKNRWAAIRSDNASSPIIRRSRIYAGAMDGILVDNTGTATVEECEIFENKFSGVQIRDGSSAYLRQTKTFRNDINGIYIHDLSYAKAEACDVFENENSGIQVAEGSGSQILNTNVHHEETAGIVVWTDSTAEIEGVIFFENEVGLWVESGGQPIIRKSVFKSHTHNAIEVRRGGDPLIEQVQIYGGKKSGIYFRDGGVGRVNDCAILGNAISNIVIESGSNPDIRKTSSSESGYAGILVLDGGRGSITDCQIFNNHLGIEIQNKSTFSVQDSTIKNNRHQGLVIDATSEASIMGSKLEGNADGAWKIAAGARLMRERNTE